MASYLDAGSIRRAGVRLALFQAYLGLSSGAVGVLAAIGQNAIGCALGAFVGGRLGRKRIYKYDLLVCALGVLCIALAVNAPMLFIGTFVVGVAVGADVPTSLALVGEFSPSKHRGKVLSFTQIAWNAGPVVVLLLALALFGLDLLGIRIVFFHLVVVALVTWALRRGLSESARWQTAKSRGAAAFKAIFRGSNLRALSWTATVYVFWGLAAGTAGLFTPYIAQTLHAGGQAAGVALSCAGFVIGILATIPCMRYLDRGYRTRRPVGRRVDHAGRRLRRVPVPAVQRAGDHREHRAARHRRTITGEAVYKILSQELFPTLLRGTAQGFTFAVARTVLGVWSFSCRCSRTPGSASSPRCSWPAW